MPDSNDSSPKELQPGELTKTLVESVLKDDEIKKSLGRRTTQVILATGFVAVVKLAGAISFVSWSATPLVGITITFLIAAIEDWLKSGRPSTVFYLCPEEQKFIPIRHSSPPIYRKMKSCSCGCRLIKKCQQGKHEILSTDPDNPDAFPRADECCQLCDPALPKSKRTYLPEISSKSNKEPSQQVVG